MTFHHVGIAVRSIEDSAKWYQAEGYTLSETILDPIQNVSVAFLERADSPRLELVQPVDSASPVNNILKKVGVSAYHSCYEVADIQQKIEELELQDFRLMVEPVPAVAFQNRRICFLYHIDNGLIELLEK
jgi:hypothetical protein